MTLKIALVRLAIAILLTIAGTSLRAEKSNSPAPVLDREKCREELEKMTPEERRAKIEALRKERAAATQETPRATAEYRRAQLRKKLEDLRRRKAEGSITPQEQSLLDRLERSVEQVEQTRAKRAPPFPPRGDFALFRVLTEEQRASLRQAMNAQRDPMRALEEKLRDARKAVWQASITERIDPMAVRSKALEAGKLEAELAVLRAQAISTMKPPLSAEQIGRLRNLPSSFPGEARGDFRLRPQRPPRS